MEGVVSRRLLEVKRLLALNSTTHGASSWWARLMSRFRRPPSLTSRVVRQLQPYVGMYPPPRAFSSRTPRSEQLAASRTPPRRAVPARPEVDRGDLMEHSPRRIPRPRGPPPGIPAAPINSDELVQRELYRIMGAAGPWQFV